MRLLLRACAIAWALAFGHLLHPQRAHAQPDEQAQHLLGGWIGYGLSSASGQSQTMGTGFFAMGEYAYELSIAFEPRAYAGLLLTSPDKNGCFEADHCEVIAKIGFVGVKGRLIAPIPYIAPFLELGLGVSAGYLRTKLLTVDERTRGVSLHFPVTFGLALGEHHNFELAFLYLYHPSEKQVAGAVALGMTFALHR